MRNLKLFKVHVRQHPAKEVWPKSLVVSGNDLQSVLFENNLANDDDQRRMRPGMKREVE